MDFCSTSGTSGFELQKRGVLAWVDDAGGHHKFGAVTCRST